MKRVWWLSLVLMGCAHRYMLVTASGALECPQVDLKQVERDDGYHVSGCGRRVVCSRAWASGPDDWNCVTEKP